MAKPGCRSESFTNVKTRLQPPLSDPAKLDKVSHHHKLLCQSSKEPLPAEDIASAYEQKRRTGQKLRFSRVLQPTFLGPKTRQQMDTYTKTEQSESIPQGGEIENGDTGNHQEIPPTWGVGYLSRFQVCPLPHTTRTVQEISKILYPGQNVSVQSTAIRTVHSSHGIYSGGKGGKIDSHTQGFKDLPIPRRLVGERKVPPSLSPAYTRSSKNVSGARLAGEFREIRAGTQTGLRLCRLPVGPQVRSGPTNTGLVAEPSTKNTNTAIPTGLSGLAIYVLDRSINCHRETRSPRPTTHETHTSV